MKYERLTGPPLNNNSYIVWDENTFEAIVIDPAQGSKQIIEFAKKENLTILMIVNTHYHFDHTFENAALKNMVKTPVLMHGADISYYEKDTMAENFLKIKQEKVTINVALKEGDRVKFGHEELAVLHTPGHSTGSICLYSSKHALLFTGDTLFAGTYGRVDLPGSDPTKMNESLGRLARFPSGTHLLPGHGKETELGNELWWLEKFKK